MQKPSIGKIVHYTNLGDKDGKFPPEIQAATITGVYRKVENVADHPGAVMTPDGKHFLVPANKVGDVGDSFYVDMTVWYRTGDFQCKMVPFSEAPERGHWNWPPRA